MRFTDEEEQKREKYPVLYDEEQKRESNKYKQDYNKLARDSNEEAFYDPTQ